MIRNMFSGMQVIALQVVLALTPLVVAFALFQIFLLKLPRKQVLRMGLGSLFSFAGLTLFLQGVHMGFMPAGEQLGQLLSRLSHPWVTVPVGFLLGFAATLAEPSVRILTGEIEKVTGGYIKRQIFLPALCIGVGLSVGLSMMRILLGFPLWSVLIPGYLAALLLAGFVSPTFAAIAFDSGVVVTGPITVTFILAMALGVAAGTEGRNIWTDGFGVIALMVLIPILAVLMLGCLYKMKERKIRGRNVPGRSD